MKKYGFLSAIFVLLVFLTPISGLKAAYRKRGMEDVCVVGWAGDGGTYDIGIQALSGAAERNEDVVYVCYDNEAYMNTGIQRSGGTPLGAWTSTTPVRNPKSEPKKDLDEIMVAHRIPYLATATAAYPHDMVAKFKKARSIKGMRYIHLLSTCPPGWRTPENISVQLMRSAVLSNIFPLYEVENHQLGEFVSKIKFNITDFSWVSVLQQSVEAKIALEISLSLVGDDGSRYSLTTNLTPDQQPIITIQSSAGGHPSNNYTFPLSTVAISVVIIVVCLSVIFFIFRRRKK